MRLAIIFSLAVVGAAVVALCPHPTISAQPATSLAKVEKALPEKAPAKPKQARKILIYSRTAGFRHGSIAIGIKTITMMGEKTGAYLCVHTEDESFFEPEQLKAFDAVFMLNTTGDCLRPKAKDGESKEDLNKREEALKASLKDFVTSGKGLIGIHAATDTYHDWKDYDQMMGGTFARPSLDPEQHRVDQERGTRQPGECRLRRQGLRHHRRDLPVFRTDTALPSERRYLLTLDDDEDGRQERQTRGRPLSRSAGSPPPAKAASSTARSAIATTSTGTPPSSSTTWPASSTPSAISTPTPRRRSPIRTSWRKLVGAWLGPHDL